MNTQQADHTLGSLMELLNLIDGYAMQTKRAITIPLIRSMMDNS